MGRKLSLPLILGAVLLVTGLIILASAKSITGYVVYDNVRAGIKYFAGICFIIVGIVLLVEHEKLLWDKYRIGLVVREYEAGHLNPVEAAVKINDELYPRGLELTGIEYHGKDKETIKLKDQLVPVQLHDREKAKDLAFAVRAIALINDPRNVGNCEMHLGPDASTKHHTKGFEREEDKFEKKYKGSLEAAKKARD